MTPVARRTTVKNDIRDRPAYPLAEAARYLKVPVATLRSWFLGRPYQTTRGPRQFPAIVAPASRRPPVLSFYNLIEAHVLRALRTNHGVSVPAVRQAISHAEGKFGIQRLLLSPELRTDAGRLFLDRLYPFMTAEASVAERPIAIDPAVAFGRPIVLRRGISTAVIAERIDAGESVEDLARDYDLTPADIEQAILYERAA